MTGRRVAALAAVAVAALAEGTPTRQKAEDYPVHAAVGKLAIGAEYLVHSVPVAGGTFVADGYLVVEVAIFPPRGETVVVDTSAFTLRLNKRKQTLQAQAPQFVAASLRNSEWSTQPRVTVGGGVGNAGVILGRPPRTARFPGDPTEPRLPAPPRVPESDPTGQEKAAPLTALEAIVAGALPEGPARGPVSGYLYYPFKGKMRSLKAIELVYAGNSLRLQ